MTAAHVFYSGHVQGVGFRYTAKRIARKYDVTGFVKNLPDGRVELLAEGDAQTVAAYLHAVADRMRENIFDAQVEKDPASERAFGNFDIAY